jgi:hypothetical protein
VKLIFSRNKDLCIFLQGQQVIIPVSLALIKALNIPEETMKRQSTPSTWLFLTCLFFSQAEMICLFSQTPKPNRAADSSAIEANPVGPSIGKERIFRGGSWALPGVFTRSARRDKNQPILKSGFLGFRLCLGLVQDKE